MTLRKQIFRNSSWNLAGYFYLLVAALVALPLTIRGLGVDNYARYIVIIALSTVLTSFDLGLPSALVRAVASSTAAVKEKLTNIRTSLLFTLLAALAFSVVTYVGVILSNNTSIFGLNSGEIKSIALAAATYTFVNFLISLVSAIPQGRGDFMIYSVRAFVVGTGNTFVAATVALSTGSLTQVLWAQVYSAILALILLSLYSLFIYGYRMFIPTYDKLCAKELFRFGIPSFIGNLAPQLQANIAKLLTSSSLSPVSLNSLGITQSLTFKGAGIFGQIGNAIFPTATALATANETLKLRKLTQRLTLLLFTASLAVTMIFYFFGKLLLTWWLEDISLTAAIFPIFLIYLLFVIVLSLSTIPAVVLASAGKPGIVSVYSWSEVLIEIALLAILIPQFGVIGVPIAALTGQILITPFFLWRFSKALKS